LIALENPTIQRYTRIARAAIGMLATRGCFTKGTQSSRIFSELIGCASRAASAAAVISVCQNIFAPDEIPFRFLRTTLR
jgi:hypothetical protein